MTLCNIEGGYQRLGGTYPFKNAVSVTSNDKVVVNNELRGTSG
jgi:hypothetical protein